MHQSAHTRNTIAKVRQRENFFLECYRRQQNAKKARTSRAEEEATAEDITKIFFANRGKLQM